MLLPLPAKNVAGGAEFEWTVVPQMDCRPIRLLIDTMIAGDLLIDDILVGGKSHVAASGGTIPGSLFATKDISEILRGLRWNKDPQDTNSVEFSLPLVKAGTPLTIHGSNRNAAQIRVLGTWVAREKDPYSDEPRWANIISVGDGYLFVVASDMTLWKKRLSRSEAFSPGVDEGEWTEVEAIPSRAAVKASKAELIAPLTKSSYEVWRHKVSGLGLTVVDRGTLRFRAEYTAGPRVYMTEEELLRDFEPVSSPTE
jgi:hypothetical protein